MNLAEKLLAAQVAAASFYWQMLHTEKPEPPTPFTDVVDLATRYLPALESYAYADNDLNEEGEYQEALRSVARAINALGIPADFA